MSDLFGSVLTDIAETKRAGDDVTEPLMRRLHEKGMSLSDMGGPKIMARAQSTLRAHARRLGLAFNDYVPRDLRPKRIVAKKRRMKSDALGYYQALTEAYEDRLVLMRMGDFYEAFGDSAGTLAGALGIVVTSRNKAPMAGFPVHAAEDYLSVLAKAGIRVAICEPRNG